MPSKSTTLVMLLLALIAGALGYNYYFQPFANLNQSIEQTVVSPSPDPQPESISLTADVSPQAKIAQLLAMPVLVEDDEIDASSSAWITQNHPGFVTVFGSRISSVSAQQIISEIKTNGNAPDGLSIGIVVDHEGGTAQRLSGPGFTSLPSWQSLCAQPATVSAQLISRSAQELRQAGVNIVLAPVLDVATSHPALGSRVCSDDPAVVQERATQFINAMGSAEVTPVLKHFPGIGQTTMDLHRQFDTVTVSETEAGLYPVLLDQFPQLGVMVSHVGVENQYPDIPCSLSPDCVGELTKNYPEALIISDALEMVSAGFAPDSTQLKPLAQRSAEAILAGNDILIYGPSVTPGELSLVMSSLLQRYQTDLVFAEAVDTRVEKIARWKQLRL